SQKDEISHRKRDQFTVLFRLRRAARREDEGADSLSGTKHRPNERGGFDGGRMRRCPEQPVLVGGHFNGKICSRRHRRWHLPLSACPTPTNISVALTRKGLAPGSQPFSKRL